MRTCVWTNRKWKSYFFGPEIGTPARACAHPQEHCRCVCDSVGVLLPTVPAAVLHNWLSTTCSVIAALPQLALATPFVLLKFCQVELMWCTASLSPLHLWKIRCYSAIISPCRLGNYSLAYPWTMSTCFRFRQNRIFISHTKLTSCHDADAWRWGIRPSELSEKLAFLCNLTLSTLLVASLSA